MAVHGAASRLGLHFPCPCYLEEGSVHSFPVRAYLLIRPFGPHLKATSIMHTEEKILPREENPHMKTNLPPRSTLQLLTLLFDGIQRQATARSEP